MNSNKINTLVNTFKLIPDTEPGLKLRQYVLMNIIEEYKPIIINLQNCINYNRKEVESLFIEMLIECINKFDEEKNVKFNTWFYYYTRSIKRKIFHDKYIYMTLTENVACENTINLSDLLCDLPKILTPEEMLVFNAFKSGTIIERRGKSLLNNKLRIIFDKIKNYMKD